MANQEEVVKECRKVTQPAPDLHEVDRVLRENYGRAIKANRLVHSLPEVRELLDAGGVYPLPESHANLWDLVVAALAANGKPATPVGLKEDTLAALVLKAAHWQQSESAVPFSFETLCSACWNSWPGAFALAGYPLLLDSRKVATVLFGARGLIHRGFLAKLPDGLYAVPKPAEGV